MTDTDGAPDANGDVEMKSDPPLETGLSNTDHASGAVQATPSQPSAAPAPLQVPETLGVQPTALSPSTGHAASPSSTRPLSVPPVAKPEKPIAHGGPTRQYLNHNVTPHLLEAMKYLAAQQPEKPLLWLAEFFKDRSRDVEGT